MGNRQITSLDENNDYFGISFRDYDKIRFIAGSYEIVQQSESIISSIWQIQDKTRSPGFTEFKLKGYPLMEKSILGFENTSLKFKFLLCTLIKYYFSSGWHLKCSPILQYNGKYGSTLIFERDRPIETSVICLSFKHSDEISFLGPENLIPYLRETIQKNWSKGIKEEKKKDEYWEFKLKGSPWSHSILTDNQTFLSSLLVIELFKCLNKLNWQFCTSIYSGENNQGLYFRYIPEYQVMEKNNLDDYFGLILTGTDKIMIANPMPNLIELITNTIHARWSRGIQKQLPLNELIYKLKLKGNPWSCSKEERVESRKLFNSIFGNLFANNCQLVSVCTHSSERINSFFFKYNRSNPPLNPSLSSDKIFSLSLNSSDKLQIMENNYKLSILKDLVRKAIIEGWPKGIQNEYEYFNTAEFKLKGYPFSTDSVYSVDITVVVMFLFRIFRENKINFVCSGDISNYWYSEKKSETTYETHYEDVHTLFFHMD